MVVSECGAFEVDSFAAVVDWCSVVDGCEVADACDVVSACVVVISEVVVATDSEVLLGECVSALVSYVVDSIGALLLVTDSDVSCVVWSDAIVVPSNALVDVDSVALCGVEDWREVCSRSDVTVVVLPVVVDSVSKPVLTSSGSTLEAVTGDIVL